MHPCAYSEASAPSAAGEKLRLPEHLRLSASSGYRSSLSQRGNLAGRESLSLSLSRESSLNSHESSLNSHESSYGTGRGSQGSDRQSQSPRSVGSLQSISSGVALEDLSCGDPQDRV